MLASTDQTTRQSLSNKSKLIAVLAAVLLSSSALYFGCNSSSTPVGPTPVGSSTLTADDIQTLFAQAVEQAVRLNETINVAVVDRESNVLGVYRMNGARSVGAPSEGLFGEIAKARTAAFTSSNQHGFTTLTGCFVTRSHFPPTANNTIAGPLFGVPFSSRNDSDVQPNGGPKPPLGPAIQPGIGQPGLTNTPGGVPIFKNGLLAGGLGISGGSDTFTLINNFNDFCTGVTKDERIALGAIIGYEPPPDRRGDNVFLDGIQLLYQNAQRPAANFTFTWDSLAARGAVDPAFPIRPTPPPAMPDEGEVFLDALHDYRIKGGQLLSSDEVRQILMQAAQQANRTRAAIRRPIGSPARVFITVADLDGTVLGIWRTPDATIFSYDVSAQKARTVIAFSDPNDPLGIMLRDTLRVSRTQPLAATTRAIGFLSQRFYPPGIDQGTGPRTLPPETGPFYIYVDGQFDFQMQRTMPTRPPFQNGITVFPGGIPLYKNGQLVGGVGVSGDGVDQDDYVAAAGARGFEPPASYRSDQFSFRGVRLPYVKYPRQPDLP